MNYSEAGPDQSHCAQAGTGDGGKVTWLLLGWESIILVALETKTISTACNHLAPGYALPFLEAAGLGVGSAEQRPAGECELFKRGCLTQQGRMQAALRHCTVLGTRTWKQFNTQSPNQSHHQRLCGCSWQKAYSQ